MRVSRARAEAACPLTVSGLPCSRSDRQLRGADEARGRAAEPRRSAAGEGRAEEEGNGARGRGARARAPLPALVLMRGTDAW